jgi:hypothetical protein
MLAARLPGNSNYDNPQAGRSGGCLIAFRPIHAAPTALPPTAGLR